jgi:hypothetical protein
MCVHVRSLYQCMYTRAPVQVEVATASFFVFTPASNSNLQPRW